MLGNMLKKLRAKHAMSQKELADLLGITQQAVAKWEAEKSEPDSATLVKIAEIFEISVDELLGRDPFETIAAHRTDDPTDELPEEARKSLEEFKDYILKKYGYKK